MAERIEHVPVMLEEILRILPLAPGAVVADTTVGLAGHTLALLERVSPSGTVVGLDWDEKMLARAKDRVGDRKDVRVEFVHEDFRNLSAVLARLGLKADGILMDFGLNSAQIEDPERGISFNTEGPLDMRMDRSKGEPASALLNRWSLGELEDAMFILADERWARAIAHKIIERRKVEPLKTTQDLVDCVLAAIPPKARDKRIHPATRAFMAFRMAANGELDGLEEAVEDAANCLADGGVLVTLSYHSGEDRIVKQVFRRLADNGFEELYRKPLLPKEEEIRRNPRSRSAKLRALRRIPVSGPGRSA